MNLDDYLQQELARQQAQNLGRRLRGPDGARVNFSANDYLGLSRHPALQEAAREAAGRGVGAGASRLVGGDHPEQRVLDEMLADFKGTKAALSFSSGYATALGVIPALVGRGDAVILDKLSHACLIDGARLSGATLRIFPHNNLPYLEKLLQRTAAQGLRTLVITESVFSMDGDLAPLQEIVDLKERYGAWMMVDEAHATGLFGPTRRGCIEAGNLQGRVEVQMGTLSKALGCSGGYVAGSRSLVDHLINRARSLIYSTAPSPISAASARAALAVVRSGEGAIRCAELWHRVALFAAETVGGGESPIFPIHYGEESRALQAAAEMETRGFFVPAIRYPTVGRGQARLRVTVNATHQLSDLRELAAALPKKIA